MRGLLLALLTNDLAGLTAGRSRVSARITKTPAKTKTAKTV